MGKLTVEAVREKHGVVMEFAERYLEEQKIPKRDQMKMLVAVDEVTSNIFSYSGAKKLTLECVREEEEIVFRFADDGIPFNPLEKEEPDISADIEHRPIGGLGIYLVRKNMKDVSYEYRDNFNILTLRKEVERSNDGKKN